MNRSHIFQAYVYAAVQVTILNVECAQEILFVFYGNFGNFSENSKAVCDLEI